TDVIRESIIEGSEILYDDVKVTPDRTKLPTWKSVAAAEADVELKEQAASAALKLVETALPTGRRKLIFDLDNAYSDRDQALQLRIFARLCHYRPDLRDLWGLAFAPPGID